jgi:hypothetical protein
VSWKSVLNAERNEPRLWVDTIWLVESTAPFTVTRTISLRRGVNIVWAQPAAGDGPLQMSRSGHGVGKSAFCQLLRYVLLDSDWADERLREELKNRFSSGGVAARVHVLGEAWTVYFPYVPQQTRRALRDSEPDDLFSREAANDFELYRRAIQERLIESLPVKHLPADGQTIEWQHILPWCIRDQGGRFTDFFRWRSGRGVHLQLRAQSPPTLVKIILGVLQDTSAHRDEAKRETEVARLKRMIENLRQKPEFLKAHAEGALRKLLGVVSETPFSSRDLLDSETSVEELTQLEMRNLEAEEARLLDRSYQNESQSVSAHARWKESWSGRKWARYHYRQQRATLKQVPAELAQVKAEWQALQPPAGDCRYGGIPFSECSFIQEHTKTPKLASVIKARSLDQQIEEARQLLPQRREDYKLVLHNLLLIRKDRRSLKSERANLLKAAVASRSNRERINEIIEDYRRQRDLLDGKLVDSELTEVEEKQRKAELALGYAQTALRTQEDVLQQRAKQLTATANSLAQAVFDDGEAFARFLPGSDKRLFELGPREAEAFRVLEILIADLACLLDSCRLQSHHPGLLVHDSPREAELSDATFYQLMDVLRDIASEWGSAAPFQYIVTTTHSSMRESLKPLLCVPPLGGNGPDSYLFGKDLTVSRRLAGSGEPSGLGERG